MIPWVIWAVLLIAQQGAQTWTSRARNTKSLRYNAVASTFSNGVWFASQSFIVRELIDAEGHAERFAAVAAFYVTFCVIGSVVAHWYLLKWEKGRIERG